MPVVDQPNVASLFYGPVLLAAKESAPRSDWRPVALDAGDLTKSVTGELTPPARRPPCARPSAGLYRGWPAAVRGGSRFPGTSRRRP